MTAEYVVRGVDVIGTESFYTGKTGNDFVSNSISDAFGYSGLAAARKRASMLNNSALIHGWRFIVVGRLDGGMCSASLIECVTA